MSPKIIMTKWDGEDVRSAVMSAFALMESLDHIGGIIYAVPSMIKAIVLAMPDEVDFDYIHEGMGRLHTAYLKYRPLPHDKEMRLVSYDGDMVIRIVSEPL